MGLQRVWYDRAHTYTHNVNILYILAIINKCLHFYKWDENESRTPPLSSGVLGCYSAAGNYHSREGSGTPLQYSCLESPMDRGAWWASPWGRWESDTTEWLHFPFSLFTFMHWRRKRQPTPVFLPGESQGRGSLVGCHLWDRTESDMTEAT